MKSTSYDIVKWPGLIRDFLLGSMGLLCIGFAIHSAVNEKLQAAGTLFTAGLLLCLFSSLARFESIKGLGIEAKMVALSEKLNEADQLLGHMRNMVGLMADTSFQIIGNLGRWDAEIPKAAMLKIVGNFHELLTSLGEPAEVIEKKLEPWHLSNERDLVYPIHGALHKFVQFQNQVLTEQAREAPQGDATIRGQSVSDLFDRNVDFLRRVDKLINSEIDEFPEGVDRLIRDSDVGTNEDLLWLRRQLEGPLEELRYYLKHKSFKDKGAWLARPYAWEIAMDFTSLSHPIAKLR
ncbi:hypothetical protein CLU92_3784 [Janthinobacterium sp. 61]|uniref:hypothetical protein n=1 Tax=Janthinobacterium sp. 61 TaxID=2035209 RepID=UPI000C705F9B|nr:hypothetical protein [Janthinobacterium sp. 61]PKV46377.1 hypothetical protein CLU92_3784 [Janthinobacterium sp. 61]